MLGKRSLTCSESWESAQVDPDNQSDRRAFEVRIVKS